MPTSLTPPGIVASLCVAAAFALCASEASAEPAATRTQGEAKYQSSFRQTQKNKEAREEGSPTPFGTIVGGPLIGTRIGQPIGESPARERQRPESKDIDEQQAKIQRLQRDLQQREKSNKRGDVDKFGRWMVGDDGGGDVDHALRKEAASAQKASDQLKARQSGIDQSMRELQGAQAPLGKPRLTTTRPCQPAPDCGAARIAPR